MRLRLHSARALAEQDARSHGCELAVYEVIWCEPLEFLKMIDWVPVAFLTFKVLIFGACMFFAIKWHYDQGNKVMDRRAASARRRALASTAGPSWMAGIRRSW